ncbi:MAG: glutathione peroxidase [Bacteroidetes bacterium]|nr:glutathione peroxidase [Bacteroidota bacterium]
MAKSIYDYVVKDLGGKTVPLSNYKGKVLLIVNIASKCGLTPQLDGMQKVYEQYKDKGFEILAFPSNDFAGQEPKNGNEIQEFCSVNYGVSFKVMAKDHVKGSDAQPLYKFLAKEAKIAFVDNYPMWNFHKYLIGKDGRVIDYFVPVTKPESGKIANAIEAALAEKTA